MKIQTAENNNGKFVARFKPCAVCKWRTIMTPDHTQAMEFDTAEDALIHIKQTYTWKRLIRNLMRKIR